MSKSTGGVDISIAMMASKYKKQDYDKLRAACRMKRSLFEDDCFLADNTSLFKSKAIGGIVWKRPHVGSLVWSCRSSLG